MRIGIKAIAVALLICTTFVQAKDQGWPIGLENATVMYSCLSAKEDNIVVWVNKEKEVVAIASASDQKQLPQFIYPMLADKPGYSPNINKTKAGYMVNIEGPSYDLDHVLIAGGTRFSCVENNDD